MPNFWDYFIPIRGLIHRRNDQRRTNPQERTVRFQLEQLEKREVLSASVSAPAPTPYQDPLYQQLLQAEAHPTADQALFLKQSLTAAALVLPTFSGFLNNLSNHLTAALGPQLGQQYLQMGIQQVDSFLLNLENATLAALNASGDFHDPTFFSDAASITAFINSPLNYTPPV